MPDRELIYELFYWFGLLLSAAFGNPIPEEILMASAGVRATRLGEHGLYRWLLLPAAMLGAIAADLILYSFGRVFGTRLLESPLLKRLSPPEKRERIQHNFHRYGIIIFILGRLVPGIRTTLFLTAGSMRLSLPRFCLADGLGALVGTTLFFLLGFGLGSQFQELLEHLEQDIAPYKPVLLLLLFGLVAGYVLYRFWRQPISTGDPEEVPLIGHQIAVHIPNGEEEMGEEKGDEVDTWAVQQNDRID